ncbi:MAG: carbon starvation protein A, partial [Myxococcota bacterium]
MSLGLLAIAVVAVLTAAYFTYGRFVARQYALDDARVTPATAHADGIDFVPTRPFYLLGQHFSAIAAAGPIVGPIAACVTFGWLPCLLWIVVGVVFIGAVHDFAALVASVRHGAGSVAEVARIYLGKRAWLSLVAFIWVALVYVIVAFTDVTASTFVGRTEELEGMAAGFNPGGAVAMASVLYLTLAAVMGLVERFVPARLRPMWLLTALFVPGTLGMVWLGTQASTVLLLDARVWHVAILGYCFVASLLPMWLLQQPRGYLGGFVLYLSIGVGLVGVLFGGFEVQMPAVSPAVTAGGLGAVLAGAPDAPALPTLVFPFLFVTIACGACSGFHGLVCGGTTSRQIAKESHCHPVGYGAMLLEGLVAVIALATVMIVAPGADASRPPGVIYGEGIARFLTVLLGDDALLFARTFGMMAVATFVFDTLDVSTRLGRYLLQELTGLRDRVPGVLAAAATAGVPLLVLFSSEPGSWRQFWTLFGTANQLLAALTLLAVSVWMIREGRRAWYVVAPMVAVMTITLAAVGLQALTGVRTIAAHGFAFT